MKHITPSQAAARSLGNRIFVIGLGVVMVVWLITGLITGKWTDDDFENRDCSQISDTERMCWDRDNGDLVPSY
jgi:hypothetical protein